MITTIMFDLGGVLFTNGTKRFVKHISEKYGLDANLVMDVMDGQIGSKYRENEISKDEFWKQAKTKLDIDENAEELNDYWIDGYELIESTRDIILELRKKYKIYYLSDNVKERVERINQKYNFLKWFDGGIFSYDIDVRKPDPKIYTMALEKAHANPQEVVFIDDKSSALEPAIKIGIRTILFLSPEDLNNKLRQLNVL